MNEELALELFGYLGTGLVLLSFLMQNIKWLRIFNMAGGLISLIYAIIKVTMPVVVLNASLIIINAVQLTLIIIREKKKSSEVVSEGEGAYTEKDKETEENI